MYAAGDMGAHQVCVTQLPKGFSSDTGQSPWSDEFTGKPWCICIWAYSNYILQKKDLSLHCESIPSKVLEGNYSLDKFQQCGTMASKDGCGAEDIRRSIESLCQQCGQQATDPASNVTLKAKCDTILASAPAAELSRLYGIDKSSTEGFLSDSRARFPLFASIVFVSAIAGLSVIILRRTSTSFHVINEGQSSARDSAAGQNADEYLDREALIAS